MWGKSVCYKLLLPSIGRDYATLIKYRPDIDGLRCIAVLLVVGFHAFPRASALRFGFIGVDIFFVISGYLITSMILRDDFRISRFDASAQTLSAALPSHPILFCYTKLDILI